MEGWENLYLTDLGTLQRGRSRHRPRYAFHLYGGAYPFIQTGEIRAAAKYINEHEKTYSAAGLEQSKLWPKGTLCITIAANIAELALLTYPACFPDSVLGFNANENDASQEFVFYLLTFFQRQLKHAGEGSVQDNINLGTFQNIEFPIPPLPEQKAIAGVLSSLDDKIDLLHRQNKTLEALAETLFRQWFIEEARDDWAEISVKKFADHSKVTVSPSKQSNILFQHYSLPAFDSGKTPTEELGQMIKSNKYAVPKNSLLISKLNPRVSRVWPISENISETAICSTEFQVAVPKKPVYYAFVYSLFKSHAMRGELTASASGTSGSHQRINPADIFDYEFPRPPESLIEKFSEIVMPGIEKIFHIQKQIQTLENLRDTLLPKLMSGAVRVRYEAEAA